MELANRIAGAAVVIGLGLSVLPAHAAYVVDLTQVADASQPLKFDVVATGSGTIDLTDLSFIETFPDVNSGVNPSIATVLTGPASGGSADVQRVYWTGEYRKRGLHLVQQRQRRPRRHQRRRQCPSLASGLHVRPRPVGHHDL
jgi:hypothetical protein